MRVIRADVLGMCFGVRDALAVVDGIEDPWGVVIHGELVHNEVVLDDLKARGFAMRSEAGRSTDASGTPSPGRVLVTAHGISERERRRLEASGATLIDATCPLVVRVHQTAKSLEAQGYHVLVIGRKGHVEVRGIVEDLDHAEVLETQADVRRFPHEKLGIICQTTAVEHHVAEIRRLVIESNPQAEVRFVDTVCLPTKEHQRALERMLDAVDAVVVVGGKDSNNTRQLVDRARQRGRPVFHVQSAADLDPRGFRGFAAVGLTAGTSTLDGTIEEVHRALIAIGSRDASSRCVHFEHPSGRLSGMSVEEEATS